MPEGDEPQSSRLGAIFRRRTTIALLLVAVLSTLSMGTLRAVISTQASDAPTINVSGRQRMLSQRIAGLVVAVRAGDPSARPELDAAIAEMESAHRALVSGDPARGLSPLPTRGPVHDIYLEAGGLGDTVPRFLENARAAASGDDDAARAVSEDARAPLLEQMHRAVNAHEQASRERTAWLAELELGLWGATLLLLLLEAVFIFRPTARHIERQVARVQRHRAQLSAYQRRAGLVLGAIEECLVPVDRGGIVKAGLSAAARARFPALAPGVSLRAALQPDGLVEREALERMVELLDAGAAFHAVSQRAPSRMRFGDDTFQLKVRPIREDDEIVGVLLILRDVTDQLKAAAEAERSALLQDHVNAANEANEAKSRFLTMMSHELRTPLNAIIGYAEMLTDEVEDGDAIESTDDLNRITGSARHLLALINQVLDLAKVESGKLEVEVRSCATQTLVSELSELALVLCANKNNRFETELAWTTATLQTDEVRLKQILTNLLSNAAKFTENGSITLKVWEEAETMVFAVQDSGIGMSPAQQTKVWEEFSQADSSTTRKFGGTGLGLPLARQLAERLGGSLEMESALGEGTTMILRTPLVVEGAAVRGRGASDSL